ncbi:hypothetical protein ABIE56_000351 [Luteibacter sp. 621]|uniref:DUF6988 family protein n=1 Tax=Luteibacter sp. 621 TaxID=3373916 RepID=UPI003D1D27BB
MTAQRTPEQGETGDGLADVLAHTEAFAAAVLPLIDRVPFDDTPRAKLTMAFLGLAHEHWMAQRALMGAGLFHSAIALLRLQFEATLKAFWVAHAATDHWIARMGTVRVRDSDGRIQEPDVPSIGELLKDLERTAPPRAAALLALFKSIAWRELNSFVHGGTLALSNLAHGMPEPFLVQMLKNANGVWGLGMVLAAAQLTDKTQVMRVIAAQHAHRDCLPPFNAP